MVSVISLKAVWWLGLGISGLGFLLAGGEKELELSTELNTEYGKGFCEFS